MSKIKFNKIEGSDGFFCLKLGPIETISPGERQFKTGDIVEVEIKQNKNNLDAVDLTFEDGEVAEEVSIDYFSKPIDIDFPPRSKIENRLFSKMELSELTGDILVVELTASTKLRVDWLPENEPEGQFHIKLYTMGEEILSETAKTPREVANRVQELCHFYDAEWMDGFAERVQYCGGIQGLRDLLAPYMKLLAVEGIIT